MSSPPPFYHKALRGDVGELSAWWTAQVENGKWSAAAQVALALAGGEVGTLMAARMFADVPGMAGRRAFDDRLLLAFLRQDTAALQQVASMRNDSFGELWSSVVGDADAPDVDGVLAEAREAGDSLRTIDVMCLEALGSLDRGEIDDAVQAARRASRMAATEGAVQREYFANLVLARARRYSAQPAAGLRILHALDAVVTLPWRGWLEWELVFCGARLDSAHSPSAAALQSHLDGTADAVPLGANTYNAFVDEQQLLLEATTLVSSGGIDAWGRGEEGGVPPALCGLIVPTIDAGGMEAAGAFVVVKSGQPVRRVLGQALKRSGLSIEGLSFNLAARRTHVALAVLALSEGMEMGVKELFRAVYGFSFVDPKHQGTFRVLLHRMRAALTEGAEIAREGEVCRLVSHVDLILPDPRCVPDLDEMVLRLLGREGKRLSIDEIATNLSVPRRTVQRALKGLVDVGSCEVVSEGRNAFYRMEDTTFSNPTLTRLRGSPTC